MDQGVLAAIRRQPSVATFLILLILIAPAMALIPLDFGFDNLERRGALMGAGTGLTVYLMEALLILAASAGGRPLAEAWRDIPKLSRIGLSVLLVAALVGAIANAVYSGWAITYLIGLVLHLRLGLAVYDLLKRKPELAIWPIWAALATGILVYLSILAVDLILFPPYELEWVYALAGVPHLRSLGFFALVALAAGLVLALEQDAPARIRWLGWVAGIVGMALAVWTASRGGLLAILVSLGALVLASPSARWRVVRAAAIIVSAGVAIAALLPVPFSSYGIGRLLGSVAGADSLDALSSGRTQMWLDTLGEIAHHPWFGHGANQFHMTAPEPWRGFNQPHNVLLQYLFDFGAIGLAGALLVALGLTLKWKRADFTGRPVATMLVAGLVTYALYDAALYYPYPILVFVIALASLAVPSGPGAKSVEAG